VKVAEWVDNALLTNPNLTEEWVRNALVFLPDHPLLHISMAGFETDFKRADFLRSFGLARLPKNSVVCRRAGEMLLAQHRPELALAAVDKALLIDPADLSPSVFLTKLWRRCPDRDKVMATKVKRAWPVCGTLFLARSESCPVCALGGALGNDSFFQKMSS
jgi:hypothetical protein